MNIEDFKRFEQQQQQQKTTRKCWKTFFCIVHSEQYLIEGGSTDFNFQT